jgi:uncharacterized membrane protein
MNKKIFFVFFFAFIIRLIALNQSLWLDEAVTAKVVMNYGFTEIVSKFSPTDFHPPLYYLFMKLWTNMFGYSEVALRMPSVLFSLMTGYVVYLIGGIWAASFFLFNPLIVYYSQEARMYMMATLFLTGALYYLLKNLRVNELPSFKLKNQIIFCLLISLAFLTFYGSIFFIATIFIYLLYKKQYKEFFVSCFLFLVAFALISPLLYHQLINSKIALASVTNWSLVLGKANIKNLLLIPIKFSIGRISFYPKWLYWGIAGIWTTFVSSQILKIKKVFLFYYLLAFPLILGFLVSFFAPMLQYFRFIYLIPIMAILLAKKNTTVYYYGVAIGFTVFSLAYLLFPQFHREDWKSLVKNLPKNKPVYMIMSSSDPVKYYSSNLKINDLASFQVGKLEKEIVVIPFSAGVYGLDYKGLLNKNSYQLKKEVSFREVTFEQWSRSK